MTGCLAQAIALGCAGDIFPDWRIADRLLRRASLQRGLIDGKGFAQWLTR
ncbi:hypothetical protein LNQ52_15560 [Klebsiella pneumoniae subsp. pneumoniae]|nr:hypothetical protein [Klebsiella pneumoniae subsp. pneumoniae]